MLEYSKIIFITACLIVSVIIGNKGKWGFQLLVISAALASFFDLLQQNYGGAPFSISFLLIFGPAYWFFIQTILKNIHFTKKLIPHFVPFFISFVFIEYWQILIFIGTVSQLVYLYLCFQQINNYHNSILQRSSDALTHSIRNVYIFLGLLSSLIFVDLVRLNIQQFIGFFYNNLFVSTQNILITISLAFIARFLLFDIDVFYDWTEEQKQPEREEVAARDLFLNIEKIIVEGEFYLIPRLTLRELSYKTGLSEKDISWAINVGKGVNFNDYINGLRIATFKKNVSLCSGKINILEQAFECGFNSKSSFNQVFKNMTGETPSQFIKSYQQNE